MHTANKTGEPFYDFYKGWRGKTPVNAVRLAIADHQSAPYSSGVGNMDFVQQLRAAEVQLKAYPEIVKALEAIASQPREGTVPQQVVRLQRIARAALDKARSQP